MLNWSECLKISHHFIYKLRVQSCHVKKDEMYNIQYRTYDYKSNAHIYCFALAYVVLHNSLYAKSHLVLYNMYISQILDIKALLSKLNMYFLLIKLKCTSYNE